jgi:hypothetical protein
MVSGNGGVYDIINGSGPRTRLSHRQRCSRNIGSDKAAQIIESRQLMTKSLSALARIEPYIKGLQSYSGIIGTFAQVKPEILCLIWVLASRSSLFFIRSKSFEC